MDLDVFGGADACDLAGEKGADDEPEPPVDEPEHGGDDTHERGGGGRGVGGSARVPMRARMGLLAANACPVTRMRDICMPKARNFQSPSLPRQASIMALALSGMVSAPG